MKFFTRGLVLFVLSLGMLVFVGCGEDNEAEGKRLAKDAGDPGAPSPKGIPKTTQAPSTTQEERFKQATDAQKDQGYPGTKKR